MAEDFHGIGGYIRQKARVKEQLRERGRATYADFEPRIPQLDGVMKELMKQGWDIETLRRSSVTVYILRGEPKEPPPREQPKQEPPESSQESLF